MTPTNPGPWLIPGLNDRLIELHALTGIAAMTMAEIASKLSFEFEVEIGRNAVIGRCRRLGLPVRPSPLPPAGKKPRKSVRIDAPIAPLEARPARQDESLSIYQLHEGDCHWPLGAVADYPPFQYCGKPSLFGRPYCKAHSKRAYNAPSKVWS